MFLYDPAVRLDLKKIRGVSDQKQRDKFLACYLKKFPIFEAIPVDVLSPLIV